MAQFWTNRSQVFRNAAALAGITACLLLALFGLMELAGLGALLGPMLIAVWLLLACLAWLFSLLADFSENRKQLVFCLPPLRLLGAACRVFSFSPAPTPPPPRLAV